MNRKRNLYLLTCLLLLLSGCGQFQDCLLGDEERLVEIAELPYYDRLTLYDGIALVLDPKQEKPLILSGPGHLIRKVSYTVTDSLLELKSSASCQWRHPEAKLQAFVSPAGLKEITQSGYGRISATDTVRIDFLVLKVLDGTGEVELVIVGNQLRIVSNGLANLYLSGTLNKLFAGFYYNDGQLHAENLHAQEVDITHRGSNFMKVRPAKKLQARLNGAGDLHCYGLPADVQLEETDSGRLIYFD